MSEVRLMLFSLLKSMHKRRILYTCQPIYVRGNGVLKKITLCHLLSVAQRRWLMTS